LVLSMDPLEDDTSWRGDEHLEDWPKECAGPEYFLLLQYLEQELKDKEAIERLINDT